MESKTSPEGKATSASQQSQDSGAEQPRSRTPSQSQASRHNGSLGGVKTDAGKAISSQNARSHCFRVEHSLVTNKYYSESPSDVAAYYEDLARTYNAIGPQQHSILQEVAYQWVISSRPRIFAATMINQEIQKTEGHFAQAYAECDEQIAEQKDVATHHRQKIDLLRKIERGEALSAEEAREYSDEELAAELPNILATILRKPDSPETVIKGYLNKYFPVVIRESDVNPPMAQPVRFSERLKSLAGTKLKDKAKQLELHIGYHQEVADHADSEVTRLSQERQRLEREERSKVLSSMSLPESLAKQIERYEDHFRHVRGSLMKQFYNDKLFCLELERRRRDPVPGNPVHAEYRELQQKRERSRKRKPRPVSAKKKTKPT